MSTHELRHLGINWTGASRLPDGRRVLLGENPDSRRVWSIDPTTGIGEPMAVLEIGSPRRSPGPAPRVEARSLPTRAPRRLAEAAAETPRDEHGPELCPRCNERRLYRLRFTNDESLTKCLNCGELVVDGHVERSGRPRMRRQGRPRGRREQRTATLPLPFGRRPQDDAA